MKISARTLMACTLIGVSCTIIGIFVGWLLCARRVVPNPQPDPNLAVYQLLSERLAAENDSLEKAIAFRDSAALAMERVHLAEAAALDSLRLRYDAIHAYIPTAGARGLRRLADSLLTGLRANRERYVALMDSAGYGVLHPRRVPRNR